MMEVLAFQCLLAGDASSLAWEEQNCDGATVWQILRLFVREPWSFCSVWTTVVMPLVG
ncbi:protein of unknown function [Ectopseudomonas oleovorans]|nr:protein of unknown function [Pseudomonas oleovorans]